MDDTEAKGWDAIDAALRPLYGDAKPVHVAPAVPAALGGNDPLDGISAYRSTWGGQAHWHYVTYGLSELYEKITDDPEVSGYGFELTFRLVDPQYESAPPWAFSLLQNLARYVFTSGNVFEPGHHLSLNSPIAVGRETRLVAAAFIEDPQLPAIDTPHGKLKFLQLVGLTQDEYEAARAWDTRKLLAIFQGRNPSLLTDLTRASYLDEPANRNQVDEATTREGSSMGELFCPKGAFERDGDRFLVRLPAKALGDIQRVALPRLALGRPMLVHLPGASVALESGEATRVLEVEPQEEGVFARIALSAADREGVGRIPDQPGEYPLPSGAGIVGVLPR